MKPNELVPAEGHRRAATRKGRGPGSGLGKTAGRGHKGQWSRSGGGVRAGFEGGQMPLDMRLPKRGFTNLFRVAYVGVNVGQLEVFEDGTLVTPALLKQVGIVRQELHGVKILGHGELTKRLTVQATAFSETAKQKIEGAQGSIEVV